MCHIVSLIFDGDCRAAELRKGWSGRQPEAVVRVYSYLLQVEGREAAAAAAVSLQHWKQEARWLGRIWSTSGGETIRSQTWRNSHFDKVGFWWGRS